MFVVYIKGFMFPFNKTSLSLHAHRQHFTFSKIKINSEEKLHIIVENEQSVRPPPHY